MEKLYEFEVTFRTSQINFDLLDEYQDNLDIYLKQKIQITDLFSYKILCFIIDIHPILSEKYRPVLTHSKKNSGIALSMNTTNAAFMGAKNNGQGLKFLKQIIDDGLLFHKQNLLKAGLMINI